MFIAFCPSHFCVGCSFHTFLLSANPFMFHVERLNASIPRCFTWNTI